MNSCLPGFIFVTFDFERSNCFTFVAAESGRFCMQSESARFKIRIPYFPKRGFRRSLNSESGNTKIKAESWSLKTLYLFLKF
ncbi:hypothetical protein TNCV_3118031 [Trichonephila clavipes]|uniref:Uncharacterized protein n=1 Tax=Trichonephila clavipes TaxID=2585209 RepID=A0A8X6WAL7_TRICX|nr:hypothetical protein TNCV_3118031 [Trichonephila clavipes]